MEWSGVNPVIVAVAVVLLALLFLRSKKKQLPRDVVEKVFLEPKPGPRRHICIFGASRNTGIWFLAQALAQGHKITAAVRDIEKFKQDVQEYILPQTEKNLRVVKCDARVESEVEAALGEDVDAVLISLASKSKIYHKAVPTREMFCKNLVKVFRKREAEGKKIPRRILAVTSLGVDTTELLRAGCYVYYYVVKPLLTYDVYPDMEYLESTIQKELLQVGVVKHSFPDKLLKYDWTIIRPPGLKTANDKKYRTQRGQSLPGGGWLGRAQLADNLLDLLNDSSSFNQIVYTAI